ncbi:uncharacterized protein KRP23_15257 [Phytophthora ramorum]|uniref:uncharacterized protein n=1 Tax=Phytophthora ramorum TaxID=164328 RepID=UPI00309E5922|nr:hypothetical protein KRP23_15257 [Phytophthora ramorum]
MSVRHEVVTLSQLLRRNENSNSRRAAGRAPSLPLQGSAGHRTAGRQSTSVPLTERPATSRYQPLTFTERVRDASRLSTSQPEGGASSQTSGGFPLSHEVERHNVHVAVFFLADAIAKLVRVKSRRPAASPSALADSANTTPASTVATPL